jgi:flavin-binding protein dodecin
LYLVAVLACAIAVLHYLGIDLVVDHFSARLAELTLLAVGLLALQVATQDSKLFHIARDVSVAPSQIIDALQGVRFQEFEDSPTYLRYLTERIQRAHKSIDDLTWGRIPTAQVTAAAKEAYARYRKTMSAVTQGKGSHSGVVYRELMSFPDGYRIGRARALLGEQFRNYNVRFYDFDHAGTPRLLQFLLIDRCEVLIGINGETGIGDKFVSITSAGLAEAMSTYFEVCWREAILLKDGDTVDRARWSALEARFPQAHT